MAAGILERDTMFSVQETPWHGLGKVVQSAPSIAEAIMLAGLGWEVYKDQLYAADGTAVSAFAVRRKDNNEIVGDAVGPHWRPLQNAHAFDWFAPFVDSGLASLETAGSLFNGRRVWVLAKLNRNNSEIVPGDEVAKFLLLSNSHDGTLAVRCGYTPIRVVCNNTLSAAISDKGEKKPSLLKFRHTKSLAAGLEKARELIAQADADFEKLADVFRALAAKPITGTAFRNYVRESLDLGKDAATEEDMSTRSRNILDSVCANMAENKATVGELYANWEKGNAISAEAQSIVGASVLEEMLTGNLEVGRGQAETQTGKGPTWWHAYNAITEYLTHQRSRTSETRLDQGWFGAGATLNRVALQNAIAGAAV
jgi:phage/plasmid-like protein (TIGR03299 family)